MTIHKIHRILLPIFGAGAVGACPLCWVGSASLLTYLGLGALIPIWRQIAFTILGISAIGFVLDFRYHHNIRPIILLTVGALLLYLGRYVYGGAGFTGWPIWGAGALMVFWAVIHNKNLFKRRKER